MSEPPGSERTQPNFRRTLSNTGMVALAFTTANDKKTQHGSLLKYPNSFSIHRIRALQQEQFALKIFPKSLRIL